VSRRATLRMGGRWQARPLLYLSKPRAPGVWTSRVCVRTEPPRRGNENRMRIRSIIALALPLAGCPSETVGPPPAPPVNWQSFDAGASGKPSSTGPTKSEREAADAYVAGLASPGFAGIATRVDDDVHFAFPGVDDRNGRGPTVRAHDQLLGAFDSRKVVALRVWRTAAEQTVEWRLTGIQRRDWMGIKASQKTVTVRGLALLWTKDDGSISDVHLYFDIAVIKAQLGVGPKDLVTAVGRDLAITDESSASPSPRVFEQASSSAEQNHVLTVRAALDALENDDLQAYEAAVADDVEIHTLERGRPLRGKGDLAAYFKAMHKAIGQLDTTVTDAWGVGDFVVIEYMIAGEQLGPIDWVAAQRDRTLVLHVVDVVDVLAGKIVSTWRYDNLAEIAVTPPS
jgi:hypothetical protein